MRLMQRIGSLSAQATSTRERKIAIFGVVGLLWLAAGIYLALTQGAAISSAVQRMPWPLLAGAVIAQLIVVAVRIEAWRLCIRAAGSVLPRKTLYCAGSCGAPLGLVNMQLAAATRIGVLRKLAPDSAPPLPALCATELPIWGAEVAVGACLLLFAAPAIGLPWFAAPLGLVVIGIILALLARTSIRSHKRFAAGFSILADARRAPKLLALVSIVTLAQVTRIWILLMAAGVGVSPLDAAAILVGQGILAQLPIGGAGAAGASVMLVGAGAPSALAAAGLALTATELTAAFFFLTWSLTVFLPLAFSSNSREPETDSPITGAARA